MNRCSRCGKIAISDEEIFTGKPVQRRIYKFLAAHPEGVSRRQVADHVYAADPDGGPQWAENVISVSIGVMRRQLADLGLAIISDDHHRGGVIYRLPSRAASPRLAFLPTI